MMSGLGAGGGAVVWRQAEHRADFVDFYSAAGATVDTGLRSMRGSATTRGVGVPGAVAGLLAMQAKYGKLTRAEVMAPAIRLASAGHVANSLLAREVASDTAKVGRYEGARRIFLPGGRPLRIGDRVVQPELAMTMQMIADRGAAAFYTGPFATRSWPRCAKGGAPSPTPTSPAINHVGSARSVGAIAAAWCSPPERRSRGCRCWRRSISSSRSTSPHSGCRAAIPRPSTRSSARCASRSPIATPTSAIRASSAYPRPGYRLSDTPSRVAR
jgi:Gamma-glutamyltransferase